MTEIQTIEGGQKDVSSQDGTKRKKKKKKIDQDCKMLNVKERPSDAIKLKKLKQNRQTKMDAGNGCDNQRIKIKTDLD